MRMQLTGSDENSTDAKDLAALPDPRLQPLARATFELAAITMTGLAGLSWPKNGTLAMELLQKSADAGDLQASLALSFAYHGLGLQNDCDHAFRYQDLSLRPRHNRCCM